MIEKIEEIKAFIKQKPWFDFQVVSCSNDNLLIAGSTAIHMFYEIHITFEHVFMLQLNMDWRVDTSSEIIKIVPGRDAKEMNLAYQIDQGYQLFEFIPDEIPENTHFYIAAEKIDYEILN
jgi:hypothetical protein